MVHISIVNPYAGQKTFADKLEKYRVLSAFGSQVPYVTALTYALFVSKSQEYEVYLDDKKYEGTFAEIFFGNGYMFGGNMQFAPETCINDGRGIFYGSSG